MKSLAVTVANGLAYSFISRPTILKYEKKLDPSIDSQKKFKRIIAVLGVTTLGFNLILSKLLRFSTSGMISIGITLTVIAVHLLLKRPAAPKEPPVIPTPPSSSSDQVLSLPFEDPDYLSLINLGFSEAQLSELAFKTVGEDNQSGMTMMLKAFCEQCPDVIDSPEKREAILQQITYDFGSLRTLPEYDITSHEWNGITIENEHMSDLFALILNYYQNVLYTVDQPKHLTLRQMVGLSHVTGATQEQLRQVLRECLQTGHSARGEIPSTFSNVNIVKKFLIRKEDRNLSTNESLDLLKEILSSIVNKRRLQQTKYTEKNDSIVIFCEHTKIDYYEGLEILGRCFQEAYEKRVPLPKTSKEKIEFMNRISLEYHVRRDKKQLTKEQRYILLQAIIEEALPKPVTPLAQTSGGPSAPSRSRHWREGVRGYAQHHRQSQKPS